MAPAFVTKLKYSVYRQAFNWEGQAFVPKRVKTFTLRAEAELLMRRLNNSAVTSEYYYLYSLREEQAGAASATASAVGR